MRQTTPFQCVYRVCILRQGSLTSTQTLLTFTTFQGYHNIVFSESITSFVPAKISQTFFPLLKKNIHKCSLNDKSWTSKFSPPHTNLLLPSAL